MTIPADFVINDNLLAESLSVQEYLPPREGMRGWGKIATRGPLLPPKGTRTREWALRQYYHQNYSTLFPSVIAGIVKNIGSVPYLIVGRDSERYQAMFARNWESLIPKSVKDYFRHDTGTWVEFIAPGDPRFPPMGGVVGFNVLDSLRVYPTGNPIYPAIYYDIKGRMHLMHRTRIYQIVDNEESEEDLAGYGECALSRCIAPVSREILMNRYVEQKLDDKPPPGLIILNNIAEHNMTAAIAKMEQDRETDSGGVWGRTAFLYGLDPAAKSSFETAAFSEPPELFNYVEYTNLIAKQLAAGIGVDIQDFWELSSAGIGSGSQSVILAQKSRGKAIGRLLKAFERMFNQALPIGTEFRWQYRDPQEDMELATRAQNWMSTIQTAIASGAINTDEGRLLLANQIEAFKDVLIDTDGNLKPLITDAPAPVAPTEQQDTDGSMGNVIEALVENVDKSFAETATDFERRFESFVRVAGAQNFNSAILRATFRDELYRAGVKSYEDGLVAGGADIRDPSITDLAERQTKVAEWFALQTSFVESFVNDVVQGRISRDQISARAAMWVNKSLRSIYYVGLGDADAETFYTWQFGATKDHCTTCTLLNGQNHRLKDWMRSGYMPGCTCTECKGYQCKCTLEKSKAPRRGRLPQSQSFLSALTDRFALLLQRNAKALPAEPSTDPLGRYLQRMAA